ncbi:hypothetical protein SKAU_G00029360 [Synaphobranchus kaupii]|uniref:Uncharacterized protein n=1 Tax=Synaphobranchus kaupii TaxID=118154 RepID=A0A9Q1GEL1_SYNKA|nr:hypothetical protein SKAU_G00029360 [Synaphobranchus kaupii]
MFLLPSLDLGAFFTSAPRLPAGLRPKCASAELILTPWPLHGTPESSHTAFQTCTLTHVRAMFTQPFPVK